MDSEWRDQALCRRFVRLPWIAEPEDQVPPAVRAMTVVCVACPVTEQCARYVVEAGICGGFWAGRDRTPPSVELSQGGVA